jgi:hypothetical protein
VPMTYRGHALAGTGGALIGTAEHGALGHRWIYDAAHDPVLIAPLVALIQGDAEPQAQDVSNTADPTVISQPVTGGSLTALASAVTANEPSGTDLQVETANAAGMRGRLIVRINRILRPGGAAPASQSGQPCLYATWGCLTALSSVASSPPPSTPTCLPSDRKTVLCSVGGGAVDIGGGGRLPGKHPVPHPGRAGTFRGPQKTARMPSRPRPRRACSCGSWRRPPSPAAGRRRRGWRRRPGNLR